MSRINRFVEQLATPRFHGPAAYLTTAVRVVAGAVFVSVSTGKFLDHMRVGRKHHGRGMASLLRDLDDA